MKDFLCFLHTFFCKSPNILILSNGKIRVKHYNIKNIAQANFGAPKFVYPCRALHKLSDFSHNLLNVDFEPIVHMTAI